MTNVEIELEVTHNHIYHGIGGSCSKCPVAKALLEIVDDRFVPMVGDEIITFQNAVSRDISIQTPEDIRDFIVEFDYVYEFHKARGLEPRTFKLVLPSCVLKNGTE